MSGFTAEARAKGLETIRRNQAARAQAQSPPTAAVKEFSQLASTSVADLWPVPTREDWGGMSLDDAHLLIQRLCASYQEGAKILNQRTYDAAREAGTYKCLVCGKTKPQTLDNHPNYVWRDDRPDAKGVYISRIICSSECFFRGSNSGKLTSVGTPGDVRK